MQFVRNWFQPDAYLSQLLFSKNATKDRLYLLFLPEKNFYIFKNLSSEKGIKK